MLAKHTFPWRQECEGRMRTKTTIHFFALVYVYKYIYIDTYIHIYISPSLFFTGKYSLRVTVIIMAYQANLLRFNSASEREEMRDALLFEFIHATHAFWWEQPVFSLCFAMNLRRACEKSPGA